MSSSPAKKERFWFVQPAHAAAAAIVLGGGYLLLPGGRVVQVGEAHPIIKLVHLGSLSLNVGTQFWSSFVVGITLIRNLPRHMFGSVQGVMFPKYFKATCSLSLITLGTYLYARPYNTWGTAETIQAIALAGSLISNVANYHTLEPEIDLMNKMYAVEKEYGIGETARNPDLTEVRKDKAWADARKKFMFLHGVSSFLNLVSFASNVLHLYYIGTNMLTL